MVSELRDKIKRYKKAKDAAGTQVMLCLSYLPAAEKWANKIESMNLGKIKSDSRHLILYKRMLNDNAVIIKSGPKYLKKLQEVFSDRSPVPFDDRAIDYFHSLFAPLPEGESVLPAQNGLPLLFPGKLITVLDRVKELLEVEYLISTAPQKWRKESKIFEKEKLYKDKLQKDPRYIKSVSDIRRKFKKIVNELNAPIILGPEYPAGEEPSFMNAIAVLCGDLSLRGVTEKLQPLPERFEMSLQRKSVYVKVPSYMEFDWRRDLPVSVFRMLQIRGHFMSAVRPARRHEQERTNEWNGSDSDVYAAYMELKPNLDKGWNKNELYDELNKECNISQADGPDDIRHAVRRRLSSVLKKYGKTMKTS
jgi:hypothetical protein